MNPEQQSTQDSLDNQAPTTRNPMPEQTKLQARRRLLKAATVAPLIYTLPNGAALAATSSTCMGDPTNVLQDVTKETETVESGQTCQTDEDDVTTCEPLYEEQETGNLIANNQLFTPSGSEYRYEDKSYIYTGDDTRTLVAASCWNSINVAGAASKQFFDRIV